MGYAAGNIQIINGQEYTQYTPAWYAAMHAEEQRKATAEGTAAGSKLAAASSAAGLPLSGANTVPGGTGSAGGGSSYTPSPTVPSPSLSGLNAAVSGTGLSNPGPGYTGNAPVDGGKSGSNGHAHIAPVDTTAAESASFNKAKDQVGLEAGGALTGLRSALGGRGMLGSGLEERATTQAATSAAGQLGDVSRQQAVTRADEAQKNAEANFSGDVTQRGQDFQKEEAGNSLAGSLAIAGQQGAITQRGQDIQARNAARALEIEQAQLASQQRSTALAGLEAALKVTAPAGSMY